jgi:hypothetical protein
MDKDFGPAENEKSLEFNTRQVVSRNTASSQIGVVGY